MATTVLHPAAPTYRSTLYEWVTTTDHKKIGIMYFVATFVFFILGGVEALIMRLQLAQPSNTLVSPETYNGLVTMHGTTMVFLFVVPVLAGATRDGTWDGELLHSTRTFGVGYHVAVWQRCG